MHCQTDLFSCLVALTRLLLLSLLAQYGKKLTIIMAPINGMWKHFCVNTTDGNIVDKSWTILKATVLLGTVEAQQMKGKLILKQIKICVLHLNEFERIIC